MFLAPSYFADTGQFTTKRFAHSPYTGHIEVFTGHIIQNTCNFIPSMCANSAYYKQYA